MAQTAINQGSRQFVLERRRAMSTMGKAALTSANTDSVTARSASANNSVSTSGAQARASSSRAASIARRAAMSRSGKQGVQSNDRTRASKMDDATVNPASEATPAASETAQTTTEMPAVKSCGCGCDGTRTECQSTMGTGRAGVSTSSSAPVIRSVKQSISRSVGRAASLARRESMSSRGKAGIGKNGMTAAQTARAGNPNLSSRDLAKILREQRSKTGNTGTKKSEPCGRKQSRANNQAGAAQDAPWKVGASETAHGQTVTGTMVGRSPGVTGDEPSTCRGITGTEYLGADIFREFCKSDPATTPRKVVVTSTSHGNAVSGNKIGRGSNVTGNEAGTCKRVSGNEYISADQSQGYCGEFLARSPGKVSISNTRKGNATTGIVVGRSEKVTGDERGMQRELTGTQYTQAADVGHAPAKVGTSKTLRGGSVTGTLVGRSQRMTGDEPGSCKNVTGDDYIGQEQYTGYCQNKPEPQDRKVGVSTTLTGKAVSGTMTGRASRVTGDEPGTCKAVTGTPYAGLDQYDSYCQSEDSGIAVARARVNRGTPGAVMTGNQPGVGGKTTGDRKGACEDVSGTPYVGADQYAEACPATAASPQSPDFPQTMASAPWGQFSVVSPAGEAGSAAHQSAVTGSKYEHGQITGPFGMATGKVTGTEEARFGTGSQPGSAPATAEMIQGRVKSRISGEGMDAGMKITGDDWDRGDHVTGTEGLSAIQRNPTMRSSQAGNAGAMLAVKRNDEIQTPVSKVTGGSGNTEKGALVTYSGGARG